MLHHQLLEAKLNGLRAAMKLMCNVRKRQVLIPAKTNHLTLLLNSPALVVLGEDGAGRGLGRGAGLHLVVRRYSPSCNRIRFECMKLGCRREEPNLRPTATLRRISPTYKAGALPLSYNGWGELLLGIEPRLRVSKTRVLTTGR